MVEVFKTNVSKPSQARKVVGLLRIHFPKCHINLDLEDCDKILRIEGQQITPEKVVALVKTNGFSCDVLL